MPAVTGLLGLHPRGPLLVVGAAAAASDRLRAKWPHCKSCAFAIGVHDDFAGALRNLEKSWMLNGHSSFGISYAQIAHRQDFSSFHGSLCLVKTDATALTFTRCVLAQLASIRDVVRPSRFRIWGRVSKVQNSIVALSRT